MSRRLRMRGCPVLMLSHNFLAPHHVDMHWWTALPYTVCPQHGLAHIVYSKRADTVGEPLFWFLITQRKVLKGGDEGAYCVIGGYERSSCLWHETHEGFALNLLQKLFL